MPMPSSEIMYEKLFSKRQLLNFGIGIASPSFGMAFIAFQKRALHVCAMGVMKMGNTVPRAGFEPTSLAFRASVPPLHCVGSLTSLLYPCLHMYAAPCLRDQCRLLHLSSWNCKSANAYNYIHAGLTYTYTYTG